MNDVKDAWPSSLRLRSCLSGQGSGDDCLEQEGQGDVRGAGVRGRSLRGAGLDCVRRTCPL
eukprot:6179301-Pleurochrysis_carterae.AAC.2